MVLVLFFSTLCPCSSAINLMGEERTDCFNLNVFLMSCVAVSVLRGVSCLKFNVRNCGDVVNPFLKKMEHLQIT